MPPASIDPAASRRRAAARHPAGLPDARLERDRDSAAGGRGGASSAGARGVAVHCDAVQAAGKIRVDVAALGRRLARRSARTSSTDRWAPRRCGCVPSSSSHPLLLGGGQERRRRASTENVAAIVGFGEAARHAAAELDARHAHLVVAARSLRDEASRAIDDVRVHCQGSPRLPNTSHLAVAGVEGEALTIRLDLAGFRGLDRLGLRVGHGRAEPDAARDGPLRRGGAVVVARELRPDQHRGRGRLVPGGVGRGGRARCAGWRRPSRLRRLR